MDTERAGRHLVLILARSARRLQTPLRQLAGQPIGARGVGNGGSPRFRDLVQTSPTFSTFSSRVPHGARTNIRVTLSGQHEGETRLRTLMDDRDLYRMVDEVLHYVWDPIGVSGEPRARDEYYSYVLTTFKLLRERDDELAIAAYLGEVATERIGLSANPDHDLKVARVLLEWKQVIRQSPSTLRLTPPPMPDYEG
jgi:hypothetical protein